MMKFTATIITRIFMCFIPCPHGIKHRIDPTTYRNINACNSQTSNKLTLASNKWQGRRWSHTSLKIFVNIISRVSTIASYIQLFRERLSKKTVHATIPKGNMGYDQYTVPDDCSCRTYFCCFPLALENIFPWPFVPILLNFFEEQRTQNNPQCLSGLSRPLFPTTFLEIAENKCSRVQYRK